MIGILVVVIAAIVTPIILMCAKAGEKAKDAKEKLAAQRAENDRMYNLWILKLEEFGKMEDVQLEDELKVTVEAIEAKAQEEGTGSTDLKELKLDHKAIMDVQVTRLEEIGRASCRERV